jgi:hypothetical protein
MSGCGSPSASTFRRSAWRIFRRKPDECQSSRHRLICAGYQ